MSRFAQTYEDPTYEYISADEWDNAFPQSEDFLSEAEANLMLKNSAGIRVTKSTTFVLHKNNEELSPFGTVNS